jgi:transposase
LDSICRFKQRLDGRAFCEPFTSYARPAWPNWYSSASLSAWPEEIGAMWRFTRNNGITEGFHNQMELINRQAYGFRNFQNHRPRVKVLCS